MGTGSVFNVHGLAAGNGDALLVEYGTRLLVRRVLVDGGVAQASMAVAELLGPHAALELLVVTHIDNDHIAGVLRLFDGPCPPQPKDVWFNGFRHLPRTASERLGPAEAEELTTLIESRMLRWNGAFGGAAVVTGSSAVADLAGGLRLTVLSPGPGELLKLRERSNWADIVAEAQSRSAATPVVEPPSYLERMGMLDVHRLADERTSQDTSPSNGSSIALLAEHADRRCLLGADAHPRVLIAGIDKAFGPDTRLDVDLFKVPHHGSKANVTVELLSRVRARKYLFCTDGSGQHRHPHDQAVARIIKYGGPEPILIFNYRSPRTRVWEDPRLQARYGYRTYYPADGHAGVMVDLIEDCCS